jgi:ATP-dependent DNA helicase DinG
MTRSAEARSIRELLGPNGPLSRMLPGYEERPGQAEMAVLVEKALKEDRVVLCEAGTGTGKTLAYLLPALLSGRKVIVSTATRALQDQIFFKDLPLVARAFGLEPRVALLKGVGNYLCKRRHAEFRTSPESLRPGYAQSLATIDDWQERSESGDLAELAALSEQDPVRLEVASSSDTRVGASCTFYEECFVTRAKREAEAAQLVVVNHHLFFADLALRGPHPARVLPDYEAVVFDEAHQLEDVATDFFSVRVSSLRVERLLTEVERALRASGLADPLFAGAEGRVVERARGDAGVFFGELAQRGRGESGRVALDRDVWAGSLQRAYHELDATLESTAALVERSGGRLSQSGRPPPRGLFESLLIAERRLGQLREELATIVDAGRGRVVWLEAQARRVLLSSSPVDLSTLLRERVFETVPAVVLTSATLATASGSRSRASAPSKQSVPPGEPDEAFASAAFELEREARPPPKPKGPFAYVRARLGLPEEKAVEELVLSSPFDFTRQAMLYTPRDLPPPGTPEFWDAAAERVVELVDITGGGAFVLTTSLRAMKELHARAAARLPARQVLLQGDAPKNALIGRFRGGRDAVLFATLGFWEGVDVPGRALRLVVLEKIPFAVPTDPIVSARARALEELGGNPFFDLHVPAAALTLKQGFGRLVRTQRDAGIVALLDDRVHRKSYGKKLLSALPPAQRTTEIDEVRRFYESIEVNDQ